VLYESANKVIAVTGTRDGVGKSTLVANLAVLLSSQGEKRVLAVDLDPRHSKDLLVLFGAVSYRDDSIVSPYPDTDAIIEGFRKLSTVWRNVEILCSEQTRKKEFLVRELYEMKEYLKSNYDHIIIDVGASDSVFLDTGIKLSDHVIVVSLSDAIGISTLREYLKQDLLFLYQNSLNRMIYVSPLLQWILQPGLRPNHFHIAVCLPILRKTVIAG
jgi:cellulose biosynthesis protein BcsQ